MSDLIEKYNLRKQKIDFCIEMFSLNKEEFTKRFLTLS